MIDNGGPAFPISASTGDPRDGVYLREGMSIRDYFAAHETLADWDDSDAFMSKETGEILAGPMPAGGWSGNKIEMFQWEAKLSAALRYILADAMLTAREKGGAQ